MDRIETVKAYPHLSDLSLKNRRVFVRVDFNVPLKNGEAGGKVVADDSRIVAALPTIHYIREQGGKVILASHLGRPGGKRVPQYSLEPVAQALSALLDHDVVLPEDCIGDGPRSLAQQLHDGDVLLLENLRFHAGEEENSPEFAKKLAELCDIYVSDAFGTLHRAHASTSALPKLMAQKAVGLLVQKELKYLSPLQNNPSRPFVLLLGGAKVSDKIAMIEHLLPKVDRVLVGGAMAYAFLKAQGKPIGKSLCEASQVTLANRVIKAATARKIPVLLPVDHVVATALDQPETATTVVQIPDDKMALDIGPQTVEKFAEALSTAETIFWNGPMGVFEVPAFSRGTLDLAVRLADCKGRKVAGGGDSAAAIAQAGVADKMDFISTGGGATIEYLEGKDLLGLTALESTQRHEP